VGCQSNHLVVAAADPGIQIALLVVGLEDDMLGAGVQDGGLEVEVQRRLWMAGSRLSLRQRFAAARLQPHVLADHIVAVHGAWQPPPTFALEMKPPPSLLDEIIQHPLLTIPRQTCSAAYGCLGTCHACDPPQADVVSCVVVARSPSRSSRGR